MASPTKEELKKIDAEIDGLQTLQMELIKKRSRRELDAEAYNNEGHIIMAKIDGLFAARDSLTNRQGKATKKFKPSNLEFA